MFFDQSKTNRNHEKLKVDFHCRVILLMLMAGVNLTGFSCVKPSVHFFLFYFSFFILFVLDADFTSIETGELRNTPRNLN